MSELQLKEMFGGGYCCQKDGQFIKSKVHIATILFFYALKDALNQRDCTFYSPKEKGGGEQKLRFPQNMKQHDCFWH